MSNLLINQGTNSAINFDLVGSVNTQVVALGYGTINTLGTLPNLPGGSIAVTAATITSMPNVPGGTFNAGTVNSGTINLGTIVGKDANAGAQTGNPISVGGTDSGGTVRTALVNVNGAWNIGTLNNGTIVMPSGTITAIAAGTLGTLSNVGSVTNIGQIYNAGTIQAGTLGTITNLGQVYNAGTIQNILGGTIGTVTGIGSIGNVGTAHVQGTWQDFQAAIGTFTITLGTLATSGSVGRQSTLIDNTSNLYQGAVIGVQITPGTVTAAGVISYYLIRSDNGGGPIADDSAGTADAAWTWQNAPIIYTHAIGLGTNTQYKNVFDTGPYRLGPKWGIGVVQNLGNPLNATAGSHSVTYTPITGKIV